MKQGYTKTYQRQKKVQKLKPLILLSGKLIMFFQIIIQSLLTEYKGNNKNYRTPNNLRKGKSKLIIL